MATANPLLCLFWIPILGSLPQGSVPKENSGLRITGKGHVYVADQVEKVQVYVPHPKVTSWGEAPVLQMIKDIRNSWTKGSWNCNEQLEGEKAGDVGPRYISLMGTHKIMANSSLYLEGKVHRAITGLKWKHGNLSELISEITRMRQLSIRDKRDVPFSQYESGSSIAKKRLSDCIYPQQCEVANFDPGSGIDTLLDSIGKSVLNDYGLTTVINDGLALVQSLQKQPKISGPTRKALISSFTQDMERIVNNTEKPRNCHEVMYVRDQLNFITPQVHTMLSALLNDIRQESMELDVFATKIQSSLLYITQGLIPPALIPLASVWHFMKSISMTIGSTFTFSENLALIYEFQCLTSVITNEEGILFNLELPFSTRYAPLPLVNVEFLPLRIPKHFICLGLETPSSSLIHLEDKFWEFADLDCTHVGLSSLACRPPPTWNPSENQCLTAFLANDANHVINSCEPVLMDSCPRTIEGRELEFVDSDIPLQSFKMILDHIPSDIQLPQCGDHIESLSVVVKNVIKQILKKGLRLPGQRPEVETVIDTTIDSLFDAYYPWEALPFRKIWLPLLITSITLILLIVVLHWLFGILTGVYFTPYELCCRSRYLSTHSLEQEYERPSTPELTRIQQIRDANKIPYIIQPPVLQPLRLSLLEKVSPTPPYATKIYGSQD